MHRCADTRVAFAAALVVLATLLTAGCATGLRTIESIPTIDANATNETKALFINLWTLGRSNRTLFGHQDTTAYGVGWRNEPGRSDVLETAGSFPAVYGWEIGSIELGGETNIDGVAFSDMRRWIVEAYERGGVNTISWHATNPVTGGNFGDLEGRPVPRIVPGGDLHDRYRGWLDDVADFMLSLEAGPTPWNPDEHLVPIVFRPFHEHTGGQFWWGRRWADEAEYRALWQFTVRYLRDVRGVHNLLYAYSPDARTFPRDGFYPGTYDRDRFIAAYLYGFPGDQYVDVFGLDNYEDPWHRRRDPFAQALEFVIDLAHSRSDLKIPALTETGVEGLPHPNWYTDFLLPVIRGGRTSNGSVAWVLVWRNADESHFWVPYPDHPQADDFVRFRESAQIHFQDEIPFRLYEWPH